LRTSARLLAPPPLIARKPWLLVNLLTGNIPAAG
jgi:hypothetical protein